MTGQHWNELARTVCKTKAISIWELCRYLEITPQQFYTMARKGMSNAQRVLYMYRIHKLMIDERYGI